METAQGLEGAGPALVDDPQALEELGDEVVVFAEAEGTAQGGFNNEAADPLQPFPTTQREERQTMVVELRALPLYRTMPSKEAAVALRDARWDIMVRYRGAQEGCGWGRFTCAKCLEKQQGFNRCRGKGNGFFGHDAPDADWFLWRVGGRITLSHDGHAALDGEITEFDTRSGFHTVTSDDGSTTPLILSYNRKGLSYTPPGGTDGASAPITYVAGRKPGKRKRVKEVQQDGTANGAVAAAAGTFEGAALCEAAGAAADGAGIGEQTGDEQQDPQLSSKASQSAAGPAQSLHAQAQAQASSQVADLCAAGMRAGGVLAQPCHICQTSYDVPLAKPFCVWCPNCHVSIWLPWAVQQMVERSAVAVAATAAATAPEAAGAARTEQVEASVMVAGGEGEAEPAGAAPQPSLGGGEVVVGEEGGVDLGGVTVPVASALPLVTEAAVEQPVGLVAPGD